MSRSKWAAAGASVLAVALTPGAALATGGSCSATRSAGTHAKQHDRTHRPPAARAGASRHDGMLAPGSGYRQETGSGRVRVLQRGLARLGDAPGPIDGRYGPITTRAVIRFQATEDLRVDGVAGPRTLGRLRVIDCGEALTGIFNGRHGRVGSVRELQRRLARLHYRPGPIDGRFGPVTARAVTHYVRARVRLPRSSLARSARRSHTSGMASRPQRHSPEDRAATKTIPNLIATPQSGGNSDVFAFILAGVLAAAVLMLAIAVSRRSRGLLRRRRYVSPGMLAIARVAGFRYSRARDAYVLRFVGNLIGPVLKTPLLTPPAQPRTKASPPARTTITAFEPAAADRLKEVPTASRRLTASSRTSTTSRTGARR
jgi:hypothetical protein